MYPCVFKEERGCLKEGRGLVNPDCWFVAVTEKWILGTVFFYLGIWKVCKYFLSVWKRWYLCVIECSGQCSDLQASTNKDQISMRAQGYKLTRLKDGAQSAEVPFLLLHLITVLSHVDVLADSVLWQPAPLHGVKSLSKDWWSWLYLEILDSERFLKSQINILVSD